MTDNENSPDIVFIRDLRVETVIGVYDWERAIRQTVSLDLEMAADVAGAARTDAIAEALDYKTVAKRLIAFVGESEFQLVETLAERCAAIVMEEFGVPWLRLSIAKPGAVRGSREVGVMIERGTRALETTRPNRSQADSRDAAGTDRSLSTATDGTDPDPS